VRKENFDGSCRSARVCIVVEAAGSHAIYVSQPNAVATIIEKAAGAVKTAAT
jgi:hypothetical protein